MWNNLCGPCFPVRVHQHSGRRFFSPWFVSSWLVFMSMCINLPQASGLGRVSIADALLLPRSDYIVAAGEASQPAALSVLCVAGWTDTKRTEMAHLETLGLPPGEPTGGYSYVMHWHGKMHLIGTWFTGSVAVILLDIYIGWKNVNPVWWKKHTPLQVWFLIFRHLSRINCNRQC